MGNRRSGMTPYRHWLIEYTCTWAMNAKHLQVQSGVTMSSSFQFY